MYRGLFRLIPLCLSLVLLLSACSPFNRSGAQSSNTAQSWHDLSSKSNNIKLSVPPEWTLAEVGDNLLSINAGSACTLHVELSPGQTKNERTQAQILDDMEQTASQRPADANQKVEVVGKQVQMGQQYIWFQLQYILRWQTACKDCQDSYCVDFLAFPNEREAVLVRYRCNNDTALEDETNNRLLQQVLDTILVYSNS